MPLPLNIILYEVYCRVEHVVHCQKQRKHSQKVIRFNGPDGEGQNAYDERTTEQQTYVGVASTPRMLSKISSQKFLQFPFTQHEQHEEHRIRDEHQHACSGEEETDGSHDLRVFMFWIERVQRDNVNRRHQGGSKAPHKRHCCGFVAHAV